MIAVCKRDHRPCRTQAVYCMGGGYLPYNQRVRSCERKKGRFMKRIASLLLAMLLMLGITGASALTSGDYEYTLQLDGSVVITRYTGSEADLTIPGTLNGRKVTGIGECAFYQNYALRSVVIPDTVTFIDPGAFALCVSLSSVTLPSSLKTIKMEAFVYCTKLASITIPEGVVSIGEGAFYCCSALTSIVVPDSVTSIGPHAFSTNGGRLTVGSGSYALQYCIENNLTYVIAGSEGTVEEAPESLFTYELLEDGTAMITGYTGNLHTLKVPAALGGYPVTQIGVGAFQKADFVAVILPDSVTAICDDAFSSCTTLTGITLPGGLTTIGNEAFYNCKSLPAITIPDSVANFGRNPFLLCQSLTDIIVSPDHPSLCLIDGVLFDKTGTRLLCYPQGLTAASYTVPVGTVVISESAMACGHSLRSVTLPEGVVTIERKAFNSSTGLNTIILPGSLQTIGESAFEYCRLTELSIPEGVVSIGDRAFYWNTSLQSVSLPETLQSLGDIAFAGSSISSIHFPDSLTDVGENPIFGCSNLTSVTVSLEHPTLAVIDGVLFEKPTKRLVYYPQSAAATSYTVPQGIRMIGAYAFYQAPLTTVILPDSITELCNSAFSHCPIESITIPEGCVSIGDFAFSSCSRLTSIVIPDGCVFIGRHAFSMNNKLTSVIIPASVAHIGEAAFHLSSNVTLTIARDSYAVQYCKENKLNYTYPDLYDWLLE